MDGSSSSSDVDGYSSSSDVDGSSDTHLQKKQRTEDKTRSALVDFDLLDCPICCEPLTIPIFQCDNGHLACSSCCPKLKKKCPACALPVGKTRCRAMESVVESALVPCLNAKFGCTKRFTYGKKSTHEKECSFSRCSCPVQGCKYTGSYNDLYDHYNNRIHKIKGNHRFTCGNSVSIRMKISDKILIKREHQKNLLFAVQCFREPYGVYVTVSCIAPPAREVGDFSYHLSYTMNGHVMNYNSPKLKRVLKLSSQRSEESFMLIPKRFLRGELLEMKLCIKSFASRS